MRYRIIRAEPEITTNIGINKQMTLKTPRFKRSSKCKRKGSKNKRKSKKVEILKKNNFVPENQEDVANNDYVKVPKKQVRKEDSYNTKLANQFMKVSELLNFI